MNDKQREVRFRPILYNKYMSVIVTSQGRFIYIPKEYRNKYCDKINCHHIWMTMCKPHVLRNKMVTLRIAKVFQIMDNNIKGDIISAESKKEINDRTELYKTIYKITFNKLLSSD